VEGGFYRWVRAAFGDFWGFQAGWWNWSASFLLGGTYGVLTADYLTFFFPGLVGWQHYAIAVAVIAVIGYINVRGIQMVGAVATILEISILVPIVALSRSRQRGGTTIRFRRCCRRTFRRSSLWRGAGAGLMALLRLRASV